MDDHSPNPFQQMKPPRNPYRAQLQIWLDLYYRRKQAETIYGVEHFFLLFLCGGLMLMPAIAVRAVSGSFGFLARKIAVECYAITKLVFLCGILFSENYHHFAAFLLTIYLLCDLYLYLSGLVFLRRFYKSTGSPTRSLLLLGVNFCELLVSFAIFYGYTQSISGTSTVSIPLSDSWSLLYFSCVTSATVGYGDFIPNGTTGQKLIVFQILSSIAFASVFISFFVNNLSVHANTKK